jgi:multiple sugar transport system permease protein
LDEHGERAGAVHPRRFYEGREWGKIAAGGSLVMEPVLLFSLLVRRYLVSGLTAGAVKG